MNQLIIKSPANMIILNNEGKILLLQRSKLEKREPHKWGIPGGEVEVGETFEQGIKREIKEETNLDIDSPYFYCSYYFKHDEFHHARPIYFFGTAKGVLRINDESENSRWFEPQEIANNKETIAFNQDLILSDFFKSQLYVEFCAKHK